MSELKTPSVKKNFFMSTAYQVLCIITPFITAPYLARVLGAEKIGISSYTGSIISVFNLFAVLGTTSYGVREIARVRDNAFERSKLFWEIELLSVTTSLTVLAAWIFFIFHSNSDYRIFYVILSLDILSSLMNITWFYAGMEEFKYTVIRNTFVKLTGIILIFAFVKRPEHLWIYIFINALCGFSGSASLWLTLKPFLVRVKFSELKVFRHFKGTLIYFIPAIATSVYSVLDKTLIGVITREESQNGFYEQANKIINLVGIFTYESLNSVMTSRSSYLFAHEKYDEIKEKISITIDYVMLIGFAAAFGLIGVAENFVPVFFGPGYEEVVVLMKAFAFLPLIIGIDRTLDSQYYTPAGKRLQSSFFLIIGSVVNVILNIILIPRYKALGAVIATVLCHIVSSSLYLIFCRGFLRLSQLVKVSYKKVIAAVIMFFYLLLVDRFVEGNALCLTIQVIGGAAIYFALLLLMKDKFLKEWLLPKVIAKFFPKRKNQDKSVNENVNENISEKVND